MTPETDDRCDLDVSEGSHWYKAQCRDAVAKARNAHQAVLCALADALDVLEGINWTEAKDRALINALVLEALTDNETSIAREQRELGE